MSLDKLTINLLFKLWTKRGKGELEEWDKQSESGAGTIGVRERLERLGEALEEMVWWDMLEGSTSSDDMWRWSCGQFREEGCITCKEEVMIGGARTHIEETQEEILKGCWKYARGAPGVGCLLSKGT